jgi:hypothetical protein
VPSPAAAKAFGKPMLAAGFFCFCYSILIQSMSLPTNNSIPKEMLQKINFCKHTREKPVIHTSWPSHFCLNIKSINNENKCRINSHDVITKP